jgi:uncharacterized protein YceK
MKKLIFAFCVAAVISGCMRSISLTKSGEGYDFEYRNIGLKTDVSRIEVERQTNGVVRCVIDSVQTDISAENKEIIKAGGAAAGEIAGKIIEAAK